MAIIKQDYGSFQDMATQHIVAPVQLTAVADKNYAIGDLFIFNNELYKATSAITSGEDIIFKPETGYNAEVASTIAEEIDLSHEISGIDKSLKTGTGITATSFNCSVLQMGKIQIINFFANFTSSTSDNAILIDGLGEAYTGSISVLTSSIPLIPPNSSVTYSANWIYATPEGEIKIRYAFTNAFYLRGQIVRILK